jgi:hypothetical protein
LPKRLILPIIYNYQSTAMKHCKICGKGSVMAGTRKLLRGHYNPVNWSRKYPNLQNATLASGATVAACTRCRRTLAKIK